MNADFAYPLRLRINAPLGALMLSEHGSLHIILAVVKNLSILVRIDFSAIQWDAHDVLICHLKSRLHPVDRDRD